MLRGATSEMPITGVGDTFEMKMYHQEVGDYLMLNFVVEFEVDRRIGWEPAPGDAAASEDGIFPIGIPSGHRWSYELRADSERTTVVTEIFDCSRAPEDLREATEGGAAMIDDMTKTLEKLAAIFSD
jgi:hypothetical protein